MLVRCHAYRGWDLLYALGGQGDLVCVNIRTGTAVWHVSMLQDLHGDVNNISGGPERIAWGYAFAVGRRRSSDLRAGRSGRNAGRSR